MKPSSHTDITGGILQAIEHLDEVKPGPEDDPDLLRSQGGSRERLCPGHSPAISRDFDVVALNVTKLTSDNIDPREYMDRLKSWRQRVERGGGHWRVINDLDNLDGALSS